MMKLLLAFIFAGFGSNAICATASTQFTYGAAMGAFETAVIPTASDLAGVYDMIGSVNIETDSNHNNGYWPDAKVTFPGSVGFFTVPIRLTAVVNPFGNQAFSLEQWIIGFESKKIYQYVGPFEGSIGATGYIYRIPGTDSTCANEVECRIVTSNKMLLCASRVRWDSTSVCPDHEKAGIYRYDGFFKR